VGGYIAGRLVAAVPTLVLLTLLAFLLTTAARGDPAEETPRQSGLEPTAEQIAAMRERLGLNDPLPARYARWLGGLVRGDLGTSFLSGRPVGQIIGERLAPTVILGLASFVTASLLGVGLGILFGLTADSPLDRWGRGISLLLDAVPSFWLALLLIGLLAEGARLLPVAGHGTGQHLVLPVLALALGSTATLMRLTRAGVLEVWRQDYIRTARAKGLPALAVAPRHAVPNAALPVLTLLGPRFGHLLAGAVIIESIFAWPGMGSAVIGAIAGRDCPSSGRTCSAPASSSSLSTC
jgi:peptide/nickel transport system permease protein